MTQGHTFQVGGSGFLYIRLIYHTELILIKAQIPEHVNTFIITSIFYLTNSP